jgi:hypothetical protein
MTESVMNRSPGSRIDWIDNRNAKINLFAETVTRLWIRCVGKELRRMVHTIRWTEKPSIDAGKE